MNHLNRTAVAALAAALGSSAAAAAGGQWEFGARAGISISGGKPANDLTHSGVKLTYQLGENSHVGLSIDALEYDFERPWRVLGLEQNKTITPKDIDAKTSSTLVRVFYERRVGTAASAWSWSWNAGLGFASPKPDTVSGPVVGGTSFNIVTDGGTEVVPSIGLGLRYRLTSALSADLGATLGHHLGKWKLRDTVSGRTGTVKGYSTFGLQLGLSYQF